MTAAALRIGAKHQRVKGISPRTTTRSGPARKAWR